MIAILSDIHGNLEALQAVMLDARLDMVRTGRTFSLNTTTGVLTFTPIPKRQKLLHRPLMTIGGINNKIELRLLMSKVAKTLVSDFLQKARTFHENNLVLALSNGLSDGRRP